MKTKASKKNKQSSNRLEKRNKIIEKEELEIIFAHDIEDLKKKESIQKKYTQSLLIKPQSPNPQKKESITQKKDSNINMFTEGLSYEKIDHNKYNKALSNFNNLFTKDLKETIDKYVTVILGCLWTISTLWDIVTFQCFWSDYMLEIYSDFFIIFMVIQVIFPEKVPKIITEYIGIISTVLGRGIIMIIFSLIFLGDKHIFHFLIDFII